MAELPVPATTRACEALLALPIRQQRAMLRMSCCVILCPDGKPVVVWQACKSTALTRRKPRHQVQMGRRTAQQTEAERVARRAVQRSKQKRRSQRRPRSQSLPAIAWTTLHVWCLHKRSWSSFQKAAGTCPSGLGALQASCCSRTALQVHPPVLMPHACGHHITSVATVGNDPSHCSCHA